MPTEVATQLSTTTDGESTTQLSTGSIPIQQGAMDDTSLLKLFEQCKREAFDQRWIFERQWLRNIYYVLGRQWIFYNSKRGEWQDKRLAKWIPRPVTNMCKEGVQTIRSMFASIALGINARPNGNEPENVTTAAIADELAPLLHEEHEMNRVIAEFDFWFISCGSAFLHSYWDKDPKYGTITVSQEQCAQCGTVTSSQDLVGAQPVCPNCQGSQFSTALDPTTNQPLIDQVPVGRGCTVPLSPLELAFPFSYARFDDVPFVIRMRWRHRAEYEQYPSLAEMVKKMNWQKAPSERSLQIFKSLPLQNDLGTLPFAWSAGPTTTEEEGISEYELWMRPSASYPNGLVFRVAGETQPVIIHLEQEEAVPGPLPYTDAEGKALFPYFHGSYEHVGGRVLGSGALDVVIQKQDQLNQLDSMNQMIIQRMANPIWLEPKGAEIEKFTGEPGLVVKWNPLTVGGNAKPERLPGMDPPSSFFQLRQQYMDDIEHLMGTYDILKGTKPTGVEAFSALQLLVERSQARFAHAFQARGDVYREWFKLALELERAFGPDLRTKAILTPARSYAFKTFKNTQLQGSVSIVVEDGSNLPKTALGKRAAIDHAQALGLIDPSDVDQKHEIFTDLGLTHLIPSIDIHVQRALQKQQAFEEWAQDPTAQAKTVQADQQAMQGYQQQLVQATAQATQATSAGQLPGPPPEPPSPLQNTPLRWRPWYNAPIHLQEFMKWANSDRIVELLAAKPALEGLLIAHLHEIQIAIAEDAQGMVAGQPLMPPKGGAAPPPPQGAGMAMANSNQESAKLGPAGKGQQGPAGAQQHGPA